MAGDETRTRVEQFLDKIGRGHVAPDGPLNLSSAQKAAFRAWARKDQIPVDLALLNTRAISLNALLGGSPVAPGRTGEDSKPNSSPRWLSPGAPQIGVDIEDAASLPDAFDYREHEFYKENFAADEIAYCILQPDPRMSFCGLWAAKEALIKAGAPVGPDCRLLTIRIWHDEQGRPNSPGASLSISHSGQTAIAIAMMIGESPLAPPSPIPDGDAEPGQAVTAARTGLPGRVVSLLAAIVAGGVAGYLVVLVAHSG